MAGSAAEQEKTLTLSEQWSLQEKEADKSGIPVETVDDVNPNEAAKGMEPNEAAEGVDPNEAIEDANVKETAEDVNPVGASSEIVTEKIDEPPATEENVESTEEGGQEEEATEEKPVIKLETAPADFRFPTTNQTRHCFTRYIEYHRCTNAKGEGAPECDKFAKYYRSLCPSEWIERWNEQRENGTFPGPL